MSEIVPTKSTCHHSRDLHVWIEKLHQQAVDKGHRRALVLSGESHWLEEMAQQVVHTLDCDTVLWVSSHMADALPPEKARTQLGREYDVIVFDAQHKLDVDALGAISGTLCGGGLLLLLISLQQNWKVLSSSRFHQRAWPILQRYEGVFFLQQGQVLPDIPVSQSQTKTRAKPALNVVAPFSTSEQQTVVEAIETMVLMKQPQPLVLISDRGRGKSSALGLASGRLLQQGIVKSIVVTAPRLTTCDPVFQHAQDICASASIARGRLSTEQGSLQFLAPDALLIEKPRVDLLLVDEASAIPLHLLEQFLLNYPVVVFATTVHGYEGTGRGFVLKFSKTLDAYAPGWQQYQMETPVRWAQDDPIEAWVDKLLCLDADLQSVPVVSDIKRAQCKVNLLDRDQLVTNEPLLSTLFALLVNAHYRTQPSDLLHLMDDPNVRVYILGYQQYILGAVLINEEGGYDKGLSEKIYRGERRPTGNLLAQTLTFHAGCETAAMLKYARVMRIAVHPELQGKGLGSSLLQEVIAQEQKLVAAIGTSFGATVELLNFWKNSGFELVRMGFTRDHASGTHSAVMLKSLNEHGEAVFREVRNRFKRYLSAWITGPLSDLSDDMKQFLQHEKRQDLGVLSDDDRKEIKSFAYANRSYEATMWPIMKMVNQYAAAVENLVEREKKVIQTRIIDNKSWSDTAKCINASGKAEAIKYLRQAIRLLIAEVDGLK